MTKEKRVKGTQANFDFPDESIVAEPKRLTWLPHFCCCFVSRLDELIKLAKRTS